MTVNPKISQAVQDAMVEAAKKSMQPGIDAFIADYYGQRPQEPACLTLYGGATPVMKITPQGVVLNPEIPEDQQVTHILDAVNLQVRAQGWIPRAEAITLQREAIAKVTAVNLENFRLRGLIRGFATAMRNADEVAATRESLEAVVAEEDLLASGEGTATGVTELVWKSPPSPVRASLVMYGDSGKPLTLK